jgi:serine protease Do
VVEIQVAGYGPVEEERGQTSNLIARHRAIASGVIVDPSGFIVTNAHVVRGARKVTVFLSKKVGPVGDSSSDSTRRVAEARIIGVDSESDLAVLKVDATHLPALRFAGLHSLQQGDLVFAIGSPMGLRNSVSMGVVSATEQIVDETNSMVYIQTDASINPGNSGGALVDMEGRLVGINTFILSQSGGNEGLGFAIPGGMAHDIYQQLKTKGFVHRGDVGLYLQEITPALAAGLSLSRQSGVVVADVEPNGPADSAGFKRADVILAADGSPIESVRQFESAVRRRLKGEKLNVLALRGARSLEMTIEVRAKSAQFDLLAGLVSPEKNLVRRLGVLCVEIDKHIAEMFPELRRQYGLIVAAKFPDGRSQSVDLQPGDVIHAINTLPVASLDMLRFALDEVKPGGAVALQIERDRGFRYLAFDLEK